MNCPNPGKEMMESLIFLSKFIRPHIRENWQTQLQAFIYQISFAKNLRPTILLSFFKRNFHKNACQCYHQKGTNSISYQYIVTTAILLLISTFYLSLLSLQTVIYVPFFVFQKIAFTSSIVDPDQNARISVTSIVKFQDRSEIRRLLK